MDDTPGGARLIFESESPTETHRLGHTFGSLCAGGEVFLLHGPLGAGKTCLLQGLARGLEVPPETEVVSPTFVLHCQYEGALTFNHIDAYRLREAEDTGELGFEELFDDPRAVTAVEWAEFLGECLPEAAVEIEIEPAGPTARKISLTLSGSAETPSENLFRKIADGEASDNRTSAPA